MRDPVEKIVIVLVLAFFFLVAALVYWAKDDCQESGGRLVRGVIWYECVRVVEGK